MIAHVQQNFLYQLKTSEDCSNIVETSRNPATMRSTRWGKRAVAIAVPEVESNGGHLCFPAVGDETFSQSELSVRRDCCKRVVWFPGLRL